MFNINFALAFIQSINYMEKKSAIIIGGGINGLCAAYFLQKQHFDITIIDSGDITNNCSFGNMGYITPSHYVPLASPGIVAEGLSYMLSSSSPFYIKPRLNRHFLRWAYLFYRNSNQENVDKNAPHLVNLLNLSRRLMNEIRADIGNSFEMEEKGCLMMCHSQAAFEKEKKVAAAANQYGLHTEILNRDAVKKYEPDVETDVTGAVLFTDDAHIHPGKFMQALKNHLQQAGVQFRLHTTVIGFRKEKNSVAEVITDKGSFQATSILLCPGSKLPQLTAMLGHRLLLEGGKGYSYTYDCVENNVQYPAILVDGRCAITPWKQSLRIGGTMEFSGENSKILVKRMAGIYNSVKKFYPGLPIHMPAEDKIWTGLRPVTPDGMAFIGHLNGFRNVFVAGGHAMLGIAEGAGTGRLISEIMQQQPASIDLGAFNPNRFGF